MLKIRNGEAPPGAINILIEHTSSANSFEVKLLGQVGFD